MSYLRIIRWTAVALAVVGLVAAFLFKGNGRPATIAWAVLALALIGVSIADLIDGSWQWGINSPQLEGSSARIAATITLLISLVVFIGAILSM